MTDSAESRKRERHEVLTALQRNWQRRNRAADEVEQAREELTDLLARGASLPWRLKIAVMAREAHISRETAYKLLRRREGSDG